MLLERKLSINMETPVKLQALLELQVSTKNNFFKFIVLTWDGMSQWYLNGSPLIRTKTNSVFSPFSNFNGGRYLWSNVLPSSNLLSLPWSLTQFLSFSWACDSFFFFLLNLRDFHTSFLYDLIFSFAFFCVSEFVISSSWFIKSLLWSPSWLCHVDLINN